MLTALRVDTDGVAGRAVCPRCGNEARAPTAWSSAWRCDLHGEICPLALAKMPSKECLGGLLGDARVPFWLPWPLPPGLAGHRVHRRGRRALGHPRTRRSRCPALTRLAVPADLLIVAEEPGVGLGAGLAGLPGPDPGDGFASGQPNATVKVANHEAPLWLVESDRKAVFAGEVAGSWLWLVLWPDTAGRAAHRAAGAARPAGSRPGPGSAVRRAVPAAACLSRLPRAAGRRPKYDCRRAH